MPVTTIEASPTVLTDCAQGILLACLEGLTDAGVDAPSRRFCEAGAAVSYDTAWLNSSGCEMLVVAPANPAVTGVTRGRPSGQAGTVTISTAAKLLTARYTVHVAVCYPPAQKSGAPKPDKIEEAGERLWSVAFSARRGVAKCGASLHENTGWTPLVQLIPGADPRATRVEFSEVGDLVSYGPAGGVVAATWSVALRI